MVDSHVYPGLERKPGKQNWVDYAGGLPDYIERIAKHLHYEKGMSIQRAIASAVNTVKRWARMGKVAKYGSKQHVSAKTAALAAKAVAEWEAKKKIGALRMSEALTTFIDLTEVSDEYALHLYNQMIDLAEGDTSDDVDTGAGSTPHGTLRVGDVDLTEGGMDIQALAERANAIEDPIARGRARQKVLDLAVPKSKLTADKRKAYAAKGQAMSDGSFPIFDRTSLKSAIGLARTSAQRAHVCRRAKSLGLASMIPDSWHVSLAEAAVIGVLELASTIAPRNARGRAKDGRRSYRGQGKFRHGFIPVDRPAFEAKAKGSPIAIKRLTRLYGNSKQVKAATGRAGGRSAKIKNNPESVNVDEKTAPGADAAKSLGQVRRAPFSSDTNKNRVRTKRNSLLPSSQKEASRSSRVPHRARQNWDEIPANLKTVRNGKRYVYAQFGGKGYITPWLGGVQEVSSTPLDKRKVYRTLAPADATNMTEAQLRDILNNPRTPAPVKTIARRELKKKSVANRTKEASQKP